MYDYGRRNRRHETENPMIKLIATDVDGTLVKDGTMQIDPEYMTVIKELVQKGIIFAVCSERLFFYLSNTEFVVGDCEHLYLVARK